MKIKIFIITLAGCILFNACSNGKKQEQTINISGAFALYPMVIQWSEAYQEENPDVRFNISAGGAGKGMSDALAQTVDLGMFSREISKEELNQGVWYVGLCKDAVLPTISRDNPCLETLKKRGLTKEEFRAIFIDGTIKNWNDLPGINTSEKIQVYTRSDACGAAGTWGKYLGGSQEDLLGIGIHGDPSLADAVSKDPNSLGYNNTIYIYDVKTGKKQAGMEIIPIDVNGNGKIDAEEDFYSDFNLILSAIAEGKYPSPPARELYFVAKGKPEKEICLNFIEWCLSEGQDYIKAAGYVPIAEEKIESYKQKIRE